MEPQTILWRWMDRPGHEAARLEMEGTRWHLKGTSVFVHGGAPVRLEYMVVCDGGWRTVRRGGRGERGVPAPLYLSQGHG